MPPRDDLHEAELQNETHIKAGSAVTNVDATRTTDAAPVADKSSASQDAQAIPHDYEDVLSMIGFGQTQWIILFIVGLLLMMVINESMGMSIINIAAQCDFATTSVDKAVLSAAIFVGILMTSYFWGYLSDTIGRRTVLIYSTFVSNIFSLISMFIPSYWVFVFLRFCVGCFIAGASSTSYAYLGEFYTARHRPVVTNYASLFVGVSMAYVPAMGWLILSMNWSLDISADFSFRPWRLLILTNLLPGFIAALVLILLPESPKILMSLHKEEEALAAVNWICMRNTGRGLDEFKVYKLKAESRKESENILNTVKSTTAACHRMWLETRPLFQRPYVLNFLISCIIMCGLFFGSNGMGLWYAEIQNRVGGGTADNFLTICQVVDASLHGGDNSTDGPKICDDHISDKSYIDSITFGLSYIVGYALLGVAIKPFGRKIAMAGALVISAGCGVALHWILQPIAIVACFCLFLMLPGISISVLSGAVVDLVPTHLRGKAVCICLMLGRSGSIIGSNIIGILLDSYCSITFSVFSGCVFGCALLTLMLPI